jgi:hypothetical protein
MMVRVATLLSLSVLLVVVSTPVVRGKSGQETPPYTSEERVAEYKRRGHVWPIPEYVPNTEGWSRLMHQRVTQVQALTDHQQKFDGWIQTMSSALTVPNHTEFGWGLTQAPASLTEDLRQAIFDGLAEARSEGTVDVIDAPQPPLFIDRWDLTQRVSAIERKEGREGGIFLYRNDILFLLLYSNKRFSLLQKIGSFLGIDRAQANFGGMGRL